SRVRIHRDDLAARSACAVDAIAYTVGSHVVFAAGQYAPGTDGGRRLLAHELTHVVQQGGASHHDADPVVADGGQAHVEAERAADAVGAGMASPTVPATVMQVGSPLLQRAKDDAATFDERKAKLKKLRVKQDTAKPKGTGSLEPDVKRF